MEDGRASLAADRAPTADDDDDNGKEEEEEEEVKAGISSVISPCQKPARIRQQTNEKNKGKEREGKDEERKGKRKEKTAFLYERNQRCNPPLISVNQIGYQIDGKGHACRKNADCFPRWFAGRR